MAHSSPQGLLLLVLLIVKPDGRDASPVIETVSASQEEDVVLPCSNSNVMDPKSCYRVKWIKDATVAGQMKVILTRPKSRKIQDAKRVKWEADGDGLILTKLQKSDEGMYSCEIWQGWDCIHVKNISLKVKECKALQAVKAAPSTPVTLNCPVNITSGQQGSQNISWVMLKGENPELINSERVEMNGTSLVIQAVHHSDSGWYRCKYMLGQTKRCFEVNLLVQEENAVGTSTSTATQASTTSEVIMKTSEEWSSGVLIAVACIIGIAVLAALTGVIIYRRRSTQRATQQTQRHFADSLMGSNACYEIVDLPASEDPAGQRVNSLYHQYRDEGLCTFHYK